MTQINEKMSIRKYWAVIGHPIISLIFMLYVIVGMTKLGNSIGNNSNPIEVLAIGMGLFALNGLFGSLLTLIGIGIIFSIVGFVFKKPWAFLTSAIIQSVGFLVGLPAELMYKQIFVAVVAIVILGYIAYYQLKKYGPFKLNSNTNAFKDHSFSNLKNSAKAVKNNIDYFTRTTRSNRTREKDPIKNENNREVYRDRKKMKML